MPYSRAVIIPRLHFVPESAIIFCAFMRVVCIAALIAAISAGEKLCKMCSCSPVRDDAWIRLRIELRIHLPLCSQP